MANSSDEFRLVLPGVSHEGRLPRHYLAEGQGAKRNISPPVEWYNVPEGTKSLALVVRDIDAPEPEAPTVPFNIWVVADIPPSIKGLPEGFSGREAEAGGEYAGIKEGTNDLKKHGWEMPKLPGNSHRIEFKLLSLDQELDLGNKVIIIIIFLYHGNRSRYLTKVAYWVNPTILYNSMQTTQDR